MTSSPPLADATIMPQREPQIISSVQGAASEVNKRNQALLSPLLFVKPQPWPFVVVNTGMPMLGKVSKKHQEGQKHTVTSPWVVGFKFHVKDTAQKVRT